MGYPGCGAVSWMMGQESLASSSKQDTIIQRKHINWEGSRGEKRSNM